MPHVGSKWKRCSIHGCVKKARSRGWCPMHYQRWREHGDPMKGAATRWDGQECSFDGCLRPVTAREYCAGHYNQMHSGKPLTPIHPEIGPRAPTMTAGGYMIVFDRRFKRAIGVHRIIMEGILDRPLLPRETVHHINGDRSDNRPENLELWSDRQPAGQRVIDKLAWAREIIETYGPIEHVL